MLHLPAKNLDYEIQLIGDEGSARIHIFTKKGEFKVGSITLEKVSEEGNSFETHSGLFGANDRGKGYGFCLYYLACQYAEYKGFHLSSSSDPSDFAKRAWRSKRLNEKFRIFEDDEETFEVLGRR